MKKTLHILGLFVLLLFSVQKSNAQITNAVVDSVNANCRRSGQINVTSVTGGTAPYSYTLYAADSTTVVKPNQLSGSFTTIDMTVGYNATQYYVVKITDANNQVYYRRKGIVNNYMTIPTTLSYSNVAPPCYGNNTNDKIQYAFTGGRSPYTVTVRNMSNTVISTHTIVRPAGEAPGITKHDTFINIASGRYSLTIQDSCGEIRPDTITIDTAQRWLKSIYMNTLSQRTGNCDSLDGNIDVNYKKPNEFFSETYIPLAGTLNLYDSSTGAIVYTKSFPRGTINSGSFGVTGLKKNTYYRLQLIDECGTVLNRVFRFSRSPKSVFYTNTKDSCKNRVAWIYYYSRGEPLNTTTSDTDRYYTSPPASASNPLTVTVIAPSPTQVGNTTTITNNYSTTSTFL